MPKQRTSASRVAQLALFRRGGKRAGAGRPKGPRPQVAHVARPALSSRHPVLITSRLCAGLPSLRQPDVRAVLLRAIAAGSDRPGFRLVHDSLQSNHLHAIAEARDATALSRGLQGLLVRIARALNKHWKRSGRVFVDRFHARTLRTPWEVRNALVYVLQNARKHGVFVDGPDPYTSGPWFDGWRPDRFGADPAAATGEHARAKPGFPGLGPRAVPRAGTWLLGVGWRQHGLVDPREGPLEVRGQRRTRRRAGSRPKPHGGPSARPNSAHVLGFPREGAARPREAEASSARIRS